MKPLKDGKLLIRFRTPFLFVLILVAAVVAGCGADALIGERFRAERALWQTDRETERLSIRPGLVTMEQWREQASRYEAIASEYEEVPQDSPAGKDIHAVVARSLASAATLYGTAGDSLRMMDLFARIAGEFGDVPAVAAEVALAQGRLTEKSNPEMAIRAYSYVVQSVSPRPGAAGAAGQVLSLPLHIARLGRAHGKSAAEVYAPARTYYRKMIETQPQTAVSLESRLRMAEIAADMRDWKAAETELTALEESLVEWGEDPPRDPASVRLILAGTTEKSGRPQEARSMLASVVEDYPESPYAAGALLELARIEATAGEEEKAVATLQRLERDYPDSAPAAQAMLIRGRVLERSGKWGPALETFRALGVEHPLSDAALQAPLEVVQHYARVGDTEGRRAALDRAEKQYREFLARYPEGSATLMARQQLARTLSLMERHEEAISELVALGERLGRTGQGAKYFLNAAQIAYVDLENRARAIEILERASELYANAEVGSWARKEAARIREEAAP